MSDPPADGLQCAPPKPAKEFFLPYKDSANYVCMSPDDVEKLVEWMKRKCTK